MNIQHDFSEKESNQQVNLNVVPEKMTDMSWLLKLTSESIWEKDKKRFDVNDFTKLFHDSVPVLSFLKWRISKIERGFTQTVLPLNVESSNQYITQQAALMLLAADYTGGIALCTLFNEIPVMGFHPMQSDFGA
jgi:hypothetical protein